MTAAGIVVPPTVTDLAARSKRWCEKLRLVRFGCRVALFAGGRQAGLQLAYELHRVADVHLRCDVIAALAWIAAKNDWPLGHRLPRAGEIMWRLDQLDELRVEGQRVASVETIRSSTHRVGFSPAPPKPTRGPIPDRLTPALIAQARQVPIDRVCDRLGLRVIRRGRSVASQCPWWRQHQHGDRRPSFRLDLTKNVGVCAPCGDRGGDAILVVRSTTGMGFADAVRWLLGP